MGKYFVINYKFSLLNYRLAAIYHNADEKLRDQLRPVHEHYLEKLLRMAATQLYEKGKTSQSEKLTGPVSIMTNSWEMSNILGVSDRTIRNYNSRLEYAGIIQKQFRGTENDYIIYLNPYIFPVFDRNDLSGTPGIYKSSSTATRFATWGGRKSFPLLSIANIQRHFNKQLKNKEFHNNQSETSVPAPENQNIKTIGNIISENTKDNSNSENEIVFERFNSINDYCSIIDCFAYDGGKTTSDNYNDISNDTETGARAVPKENVAARAEISGSVPENTDKNDCTGSEKQEKQPEKMPVTKKIQKDLSEHHIKVFREGTISELRYLYAYLLYQYALDKIPGWRKKVYAGVTEEMIIYIAEHYFQNCESKSQLQYMMKVFQLTINYSARFINKKLYAKRWDEFRTLPRTYFNVKYENGFYRFAKMIAEREKLKRDKEKWAIRHKNRLDINEKLNKILLEYFTTPTQDNYFILLKRVRNTIPSREKQFINCVTHDIKHIENYWNNSKQQKTA